MCGISKQCIPESIKYFGYNLEHLVEELGGTYSIDELINNHTLFSVYKPFLIEDAIKDAINSMIKSDMGFGKINTFNKIKNSKMHYVFVRNVQKKI